MNKRMDKEFFLLVKRLYELGVSNISSTSISKFRKKICIKEIDSFIKEEDYYFAFDGFDIWAKRKLFKYSSYSSYWYEKTTEITLSKTKHEELIKKLIPLIKKLIAHKEEERRIEELNKLEEKLQIRDDGLAEVDKKVENMDSSFMEKIKFQKFSLFGDYKTYTEQ